MGIISQSCIYLLDRRERISRPKGREEGRGIGGDRGKRGRERGRVEGGREGGGGEGGRERKGEGESGTLSCRDAQGA